MRGGSGPGAGSSRPYGERTSSGKPRGEWDSKPSERRDSRPGKPRAEWDSKPSERRDSRPGKPRAEWDNKPSERRDSRPGKPRAEWDNKPAERRDSRPGKPRGEWDNKPAERRGTDRPRRDDDRVRELPPGFARKANEPDTPKGLDLRELPRGVRAELRGLTTEKAEIVGAHLLMAGRLIDSDPQLAYAHAEAARRRAARLPITREATAETAYAAGDFTTALAEFRALRRLTGGNEYVAAMADCERALGRHQAALKLVREGLAGQPDVAAQIELRLVEAGVRSDNGQVSEALRLLKQEIEDVGARGPKLARARLRYGYADLLERVGEGDQAERWFETVVRLDPDNSTDAEDRLAALRGMVIEFDEYEDDYEDDEPGDAAEDLADAAGAPTTDVVSADAAGEFDEQAPTGGVDQS